jgi:hypothetical protein
LPTGKKPATYVPGERRYTSFRVSKAPVHVPSVFGHGNTFKDWGMLGNDRFGDCVFAGSAHEQELIANLAAGGVTGQMVTPFSEKSVLSDYSAVTGFNLATGENDNGTNVHEALDYRIKTGLLDANGKRHKIAAYVALEPGNLEHLREALFIFSAVGIGFEVPISAQEQYARNEVWSIVPGAEVEGGHYVPLVGVPAVGNLACVTWGRRQVMTDSFYKMYCDEAYCYITREELQAKSKTNWGGFSWKDLEEDLKIVV